MDDSKDPVLSPAGEKRAEALMEKLLHAEIDLLYATPYQRTRQTLRPLADTLHKKIMVL
jgi:broad specificity phosphatase PhoE